MKFTTEQVVWDMLGGFPKFDEISHVLAAVSEAACGRRPRLSRRRISAQIAGFAAEDRIDAIARLRDALVTGRLRGLAPRGVRAMILALDPDYSDWTGIDAAEAEREEARVARVAAWNQQAAEK